MWRSFVTLVIDLLITIESLYYQHFASKYPKVADIIYYVNDNNCLYVGFTSPYQVNLLNRLSPKIFFLGSQHEIVTSRRALYLLSLQDILPDWKEIEGNILFIVK